MASDDEKSRREEPIYSEFDRREVSKLKLRLPLPESLPSNLKAALSILEHRFAEEQVWVPNEAKAAKLLFSNIELLEVWNHLELLLESREQWLTVIVEAFLKPYAFPDSPEWRRVEAKQNIATYADIAEKTHELMALLGGIMCDVPGHLGEVDELIEATHLDRTLLKLLSLTTECKWPGLEYRRLYPDEGEQRPSVIECENQKNAETYLVYVESKDDSCELLRSHEPLGGGPLSEGEVYQMQGGSYRFKREVFRRRLGYEDSHSATIHMASPANHDKTILLNADDPHLPKFQPLSIENFVPPRISERLNHTRYLKRLITSLDELSERFGRGKRVWSGGPQNGTTISDPIWLHPRHYQLILKALFRIEVDESQIREKLRK